MPFSTTDFPGLLIYEPRVFNDDRGYFFESYNENTFSEGGATMKFVQDNQARSVFGVIRGLHFQQNPNAQTKLIRALSGTILDVVVDLRAGSPTFHQYFSIELSAENKKQLLVPRGFAHGYSVLTETAEVIYKCDEFYHKESEGGLMYNDSTLGIDWRVPAGKEMVAAKDLVLPNLEDCKTNFIF
jgi:dTDP-4-dehydrorhamnose 3,5-epimerase